MSAEHRTNSVPIGIDLGTSYSVISYVEGKQIKCIQNHAQKNNTFPSVVYIPPDGSTIYVSSEATMRGAAYPANYIYCVKRIMGATELGPKDIVNYTIVPQNSSIDPENANDSAGLVIRVPADDGVSFYEYTPVDVSSFILSYLRGYAEMTINANISDPSQVRTADKAVITVPAAFTSEQRRLTRLAARLSGLECLRILSEPTAAALCYLYNNFHDENLKKQINLDPNNPLNLLVFDLGGGTFDVSIVSIVAGAYLVRATSGNNYFGGQDIDNAIVKDLCKMYSNEAMKKGFSAHQSKIFYEDEDIARNPQPFSAKQYRHNEKCKRFMRESAIKIKESLSNADNFTFEILASEFNLPVDFKYVYTSKRLTALVSQMYTKYCEPTVEDALAKAGLKKEDIYRCVLVGGSTRIPAISRTLQAYFYGVEPARDVNPDEAVAKGAAYLATYLVHKQERKKLGGAVSSDQDMNFAQISLNTGELSAFQYSLGLRGQPHSCVINSASPLPAIGEHTFLLSHDLNDPNFDINIPIVAYVYEQESHLNLNYHPVQEDKEPLFTIYITKQRVQNQTLSFYFKLDADGVLDVFFSDDGVKYHPIHNIDNDDSKNALNELRTLEAAQRQGNDSVDSDILAQAVNAAPETPRLINDSAPNKAVGQKRCSLPPPLVQFPMFTRIKHKTPIKPSSPPDLIPRPEAGFVTKIVETPASLKTVYMERYRRYNQDKIPSVLFPQHDDKKQ